VDSGNWASPPPSCPYHTPRSPACVVSPDPTAPASSLPDPASSMSERALDFSPVHVVASDQPASPGSEVILQPTVPLPTDTLRPVTRSLSGVR
jgi:hypothetical protein